MADVQTTIGELTEDGERINVMFAYNGVTHERTVNVCKDENGAYDGDATLARIDEVANGVKVKIDAGAITNAPEPDTLEGEIE